jgi:pyrimidine deaminase RibD-like protein
MTNDEKFMLRAFELSKQALPLCRPNPPVGCVLVKNGCIVSEGFTQEPGMDHAEAHAISNYIGEFNGITAYVTLEPCSFVGRTPSCADSLAKLGIARVVVAMVDPDPRNSGNGLNILRRSDVKVDVGVCKKEVSEFISQYLIK